MEVPGFCEIRTEGLISSSSSISKVRSEPSGWFNITGVCSGFQTSSEVPFLRYTGIGSILSGKKDYRRVLVQYRDSPWKNYLPDILACVKIDWRTVIFLYWKRRQEQSLLIHLFANLLVGYPHSVTRIGLWSSYHPAASMKKAAPKLVGLAWIDTLTGLLCLFNWFCCRLFPRPSSGAWPSPYADGDLSF